jgi:hypothetical protein
MARNKLQIDSGIMQYAPKGAFYEGANEQFTQVLQMWQQLFKFDRVMFSLVTLLGGTGFSKGAMNHMMLANPQTGTGKDLVPDALPEDFEKDIFRYNLEKVSQERFARAIKNLMMLTGAEGFTKVNNARTRKLILEFIFSRDNDELDSLAVNFKTKLRKLTRHALGSQSVYKILNGDESLFNKLIGRYNADALPVFFHLFNKEPVYKTPDPVVYFKKIDQYWGLRFAAEKGNVENFKKYMKGLPLRTVIGFRNQYKVPIELSDVHDSSKVSEREKIQTIAARKKVGAAKVKINYKSYDIYELFKLLYFKLSQSDSEDMNEITEAIDHRITGADKLDIGECVVIFDASKSMAGSEQRKLHPLLTSLCLLSILSNVKEVIRVGGKVITTPTDKPANIIIPMNQTDLWRGLVKAIKTKAKNIVLLSDGYENSIKGMFAHTYKYFKDSGYDFNLIHFNPVFSADARQGTARRLVPDVKPIPLTDYRYMETEFIFTRMIENTDAVKAILINKFQNLIGR